MIAVAVALLLHDGAAAALLSNVSILPTTFAMTKFQIFILLIICFLSM
jgi:hypothetical protein